MADSQLIEIFRNVFPNLTDDEIRAATAENVGSWDSIASVNLFLQIQQEFGITVDFEAAASLMSYRAIRDYVAAQVGQAQS